MNLKRSGNTKNSVNERFESFVTVVARAYKCIQKIKNIETEQMGLKGNHVMCMYFLGRNSEGLTAAELCKLCNEDKAAISRTILDLTKKELVVPTDPDSKRKYRTVIKLSEKGNELYCKLNDVIELAVMRASEDFSEEERQCFYRVFFSILDTLEEFSKKEYAEE